MSCINMNLFIQIDVRIAILPRLSRPRWYIIVIFCGNLRNMPSRNTGKNNKNILWLLGSQILGNKTNCDQMTQKSPASASAAPIVGVFSARWLAGVWPGHTPAPGPRADINGGVSPVVTTPWAYLQATDNAHGRRGLWRFTRLNSPFCKLLANFCSWSFLASYLFWF